MPRRSDFTRLRPCPVSLCFLLVVQLQAMAPVSPVLHGFSERSVHPVPKPPFASTKGNEMEASGRVKSMRGSDKKRRDGWRTRDVERGTTFISSSKTAEDAALHPLNLPAKPQKESQSPLRKTESGEVTIFSSQIEDGKSDVVDGGASSIRRTPSAPQSLRTCSRVPYTAKKTCRRLVDKQRAYTCASDFFPTSCKDVPRSFVFDCWKKRIREVIYTCPKLQAKTLCYKVPRVLAETCTRAVSRWKRKECTRKIQELECHVQSVTEPSTCFVSESYTQPYECEKIQTRLDCEISFKVQEEACSREVEVPITYEYEEIVTDTVCEKKKRVVKKTCYKDVIVHETPKCVQTHYEPRCEKVPQQQQKMCSGKKTRLETYPCQEVKMQRTTTVCSKAVPLQKKRRPSCRNSQEPGCKAVEDKYKSEAVTLETYACEKVIPVAVPSSCTREVSYDAEYPCTEMVLVEQCSMQPQQVETSCLKVVVKKDEYDCEEMEEVEECKEVPHKTKKTAVLRVDKRKESFTCEKPVSAESCIEVPEIINAVCSAELMKANEKACTTERKEEKCKIVEKTIPSTCSEEEHAEEEYICSKVEFNEDWVLGECVKEIEEEVKESCTEEVLQEECSPRTLPQEKTCFQNVQEEEEYDCYDIKYREECQHFPE